MLVSILMDYRSGSVLFVSKPLQKKKNMMSIVVDTWSEMCKKQKSTFYNFNDVLMFFFFYIFNYFICCSASDAFSLFSEYRGQM